MALPESVRQWFIPLSERDMTLRAARTKLAKVALAQDSIPLMVQLVENPKYDLPGVDVFSGATDLDTHDNIHILLGRGLLARDEAFVLGFTMGSTNRVGQIEETLYGLFSRYLYPKEYQFSADDFQVYKDAVRLGYVSDCDPLHDVDYDGLMDVSLEAARERLGIESSLLAAYFEIEKRRYPDTFECQRLLD